MKFCPVCGQLNEKKSITCSHSCANKLFRTKQRNPNWNPDAYRSTCFAFHDKRCVICGESKIVAVHHFDGNHEQNAPENLIPLCPTHHMYVHSRYRNEVLPRIIEYREEWLQERGGQLMMEINDDQW